MKIPQYITVEEVRKVCQQLKISDWTKKKQATVSMKEAKLIMDNVCPKSMNIDPKDFCAGLEVELEHGIRFKDANVTNNHPLLTGLIVLALILYWLAGKSIKKDEEMVKSIDRIR